MSEFYTEAIDQRFKGLEDRISKVECYEKRISDLEIEGAIVDTNVNRIFITLEKMEKLISGISSDIQTLREEKGLDAIEKLKTQRALIYSIVATVIAGMLLFYLKTKGV